MPKLKVLFVFNNNTWTTVNEKVAAVKAFYAPKVELQCDIKFTNYTNIPFQKVSTLDGTGHQDGTDVVGSSETVADYWYNLNLSVPNSTYDIIVFALSEGDKTGHITASGIRSDKDQGPVETVIFGGKEGDSTYVNGINIGNNFVVFTCHEISHAIYMILNKLPDNTHLYFYAGTPTKVLDDFVFKPANTVDQTTVLKNLIASLQKLVGVYQAQLAALNAKKDRVTLFCKAIESREGYFAPSDRYPKGTASWRNKNPGNLRYAQQVGSIGKDSNNFAIFPTYEEGFAALRRQILAACNGTSKVFKPTDTILEFFQKYAPSNDSNDPVSYANEVAAKVYLPVTAQMKDVLT